MTEMLFASVNRVYGLSTRLRKITVDSYSGL